MKNHGDLLEGLLLEKTIREKIPKEKTLLEKTLMEGLLQEPTLQEQGQFSDDHYFPTIRGNFPTAIIFRRILFSDDQFPIKFISKGGGHAFCVFGHILEGTPLCYPQLRGLLVHYV